MRFAILGTLTIANVQRPVPITAARERAILAMLLLSPNRVVGTSRLIDAVWEERPPGRALSQLHACVSRLRRNLAAGGLPRGVVATAPGGAGYSIGAGPDELDSLEFAQLVGRAREARAQHRPDLARRHYRQALALWRGPALDELGAATIRRLAAVLDEQRLQAQLDCLTLELDLGLATEALPELTDLAAHHPYDESVHRLLMLALYRAGRQAEATEVYRRHDRALREEIGAEAGEQLRRLHKAILRRDRELDVPPAGTRVLVPRELPTHVTAFTGRADLLAALTKALPDDGGAGPVTVLAITGSPGVGKTALAVYWAHRTADRFPDGQLFLNLRGSHPTGAVRPVEALATMVRSLGEPADEIPDDEERTAALFRSKLAGRSVLVVLDDAGSAEQVRPLLPGSGRSTVLVTSRDLLSGLVAQDGARRFRLDVLTPGEARELLASLLGPERTSPEAPAATALADACARLPLALRIAAAHLTDRPAATIGDYLTELRSGDRLAALQIDEDRASSVSAALGLSYQALPPEAARLLRLLGLVPGPDFTPAAAASLVATTPAHAARLLRRLARSSLLTEPAPDRYAFHDLLREFAVRLSESVDGLDDRADARDRLLRHYLQLAEAAVAAAFGYMMRLPMPETDPAESAAGFDSRPSAMSWLDAERPNLVAAIGDAARNGPPAYSWLLADRLRGHFWHSRHMSEWLAVAETGLAAAESVGDDRAIAAAHINLADAYQVSDRGEESIPHYLAAADRAKRTRWAAGEEAAWNNLGVAYIQLGRLAQAAELYRRLLDGHEGYSFHVHRARLLHNLGRVELELGRLAEAETHNDEAVQLGRDAGHLLSTVDALAGLALIHSLRGHVDRAMDRATAATRLAAEDGDPSYRRQALTALGLATHASGGAGKATALHRQAHELAVQAHDSVHQAETLRHLADAHLAAGELDEAWRAASRSLVLVRKIGALVQEGPTLNTLAEISHRQGRRDLAAEHAENALVRHRETGQRLGEARTVAILALVYHSAGQDELARRYQRLAGDLYAEAGATFPPSLRPPRR